MSDELQRILMAKTLGRVVVDHIDRDLGEYRFLGAAAGSMINSEWWQEIEADPTYADGTPKRGARIAALDAGTWSNVASGEFEAK